MQLYFNKQKVISVVKTHNGENTQTVAMLSLEFILQHDYVLNYSRTNVLNIIQIGTSSGSCIFLKCFQIPRKEDFFFTYIMLSLGK